MISCSQCQTANGLDSKFCKSCGQPLPDDAIREAAEKHEKMVQEGYALYNSGRTAEALFIAQAAVEENNNSANALSLLGMCLERSGQLAESLECYERVLIICPDSILDRMKVTQLRAALTNHVKVDTKTNKWFAIAAASAMGVTILAIGLALYFSRSKDQVALNTPTSTGTLQTSRPFDQSVQSQMNAPQSTGQPQKPVTNNDPSQLSDEALAKGAQQEKALTKNASQVDTGKDSEVQPVSPGLPTNIMAAQADVPTGRSDDNTPKTSQATPAPDPTPVAEGNKGDSTKGADPKPEDPGIIEISVTHPHSDITGSSSSGSASGSPNQLQALLKTAKNEFLIGRYDAAAKTYERALSAGGDGGSINQRLGMCYEKLGRKSDAISAYTRAASAFESALSSGQGDPRRLKSALDSCRQALKVLKG